MNTITQAPTTATPSTATPNTATPSTATPNTSTSTDPMNPTEQKGANMFASLEVTSEAWKVEALCGTDDGELANVFFSEELQDIARAKSICAECPVIAPCLEGAIARREPWGVWGGQLFLNGKVLAVKRRRGRPPKIARPEDQMPTVPVPEHLQELMRTA